jgi:hypothetical protein
VDHIRESGGDGLLDLELREVELARILHDVDGAVDIEKTRPAWCEAIFKCFQAKPAPKLVALAVRKMVDELHGFSFTVDETQGPVSSWGLVSIMNVLPT